MGVLTLAAGNAIHGACSKRLRIFYNLGDTMNVADVKAVSEVDTTPYGPGHIKPE